MAFIETPRFPDCVAFGASGGPVFLTYIAQTHSGHETRNRAREQALGRWEVSHAARRPIEYVPLQAFFRIGGGQFNGFRFKDHLDYRIRSEHGERGVFVQLTATTFQMYKRYTIGGATYDRIIQKPVAGAVTVTGGVSPSVNSATGVVTVASGTPTSWVGDFDVPARFGVDDMRLEALTRSGDDILATWASIPVLEIRDIA